LDATEALERNLVCQIIPANEFEKKMVEKMQEISKTPANVKLLLRFI
jgi:1,4-dihydroxy-2-naphthoyl-CoA synthase